MGTPQTPSRQPCPNRILDDLLLGVSGMVAVSAFHFLKGYRSSPNTTTLFTSACNAVRLNAPQIAFTSVAWGSFFAVDCAMVYVRQKEDPWNTIVVSTVADWLLSALKGLRAAARSTVLGGDFITVLEGTNIMLTCYIDNMQQQQQQQVEEPVIIAEEPIPTGYDGFPVQSASDSGAGSDEWVDDWFSGGKGEERSETKGL